MKATGSRCDIHRGSEFVETNMPPKTATQSVLATPSSAEPEPQAETALAGKVKRLLAAGQQEAAAHQFGGIVDLQQRRATRIAYYYLREPAEVDDVVQDVFLKAFLHLPSFREDLFFELWFTRILVNACLDRLKSRKRRARWLIPMGSREHVPANAPPSPAPSPEQELLSKERRSLLEAAIARLPRRQKTAVILSHLEGHPAREVSAIMGLSESTVRVHLFRAVRNLRGLLNSADWMPRSSVVPSLPGH